LIARPDVGSVVGTHGTDTLEQTGTHLQLSLGERLEELGVPVFLTAANNPFPSEDARENLRFTLVEATNQRHDPKVHLVFDGEVIPAERASKETYSGSPMRFYDRADENAVAREATRRTAVFHAADQLAIRLGYEGMATMVKKAIRYWQVPVTDPERPRSIPIVNARPTAYKLSVLEFGRTGDQNEWNAAARAHCLNRDLVTPFPEFKAFFWLVNRIAGPARVAMTVDGHFPQVKACTLILNHSGTAHTTIPDLSIAGAVAQMREKRGIVTFAVTENGEPVNFGEGSYVTSRDLRDAGVIPLPMHDKVAWVKLYSAMEQNLTGRELVEFMLTQQTADEFSGAVDHVAVAKAMSMYS
ncbi:asparaginase, partial [Candidatus Roizmanbacteria bacterium]|nr:asparaginase [Candidatus Roizmanbacteria bacterium]